MDMSSITVSLAICIIIYFVTTLWLYLVARNSEEESFAIFAFVPIMNIYLLIRLSWYDMLMLLLFVSTPLLMVYNPLLILITIVLYCYIIILVWVKTWASFIYTLISIPLPTVGFYLMRDSIKDNRDEDIDIRYERTAICPKCKALCGTDKLKTNTIKCKECGERVQFKALPKGKNKNIRIMTKNKTPIELDIRDEERNEQEERLIKEYKENFEKKY